MVSKGDADRQSLRTIHRPSSRRRHGHAPVLSYPGTRRIQPWWTIAGTAGDIDDLLAVGLVPSQAAHPEVGLAQIGAQPKVAGRIPSTLTYLLAGALESYRERPGMLGHGGKPAGSRAPCREV